MTWDLNEPVPRDLTIGDSGVGSMTIGWGGIVNNRTGYIAYLPASRGEVIVDEGTWNTKGGLNVGWQGSASLIIRRGLVSTGTQATAFGINEQAESVLRLESGGVLETGQVKATSSSKTRSFIFSGGMLRLTANVSFLFDRIKPGDLVITAEGGTIDTQQFQVRSSNSLEGLGKLTKEGNGTLTLNGANTYSGGTIVNQGTFVVSGSGSISHASADFEILGFDAHLRIGDSAVVTNRDGRIDGPGFLTVEPGSTATVTGGNWTNSGTLWVGRYGTGRLNLSGGTVRNTDAYIGLGSASVGNAIVTGGNWTNSGILSVGGDGSGVLNVRGGIVRNTEGSVGFSAGSNGTATVTGGNWTNSSFLKIGREGVGRLELSGGTVRNTDAYVGFAAGSNGTANVTGGTWINSETLRIGEHGTGNFILSNGTVSNTNGILATFSGANGTATITGGTWTNNGFLSVGREGTGNLNLSGGTVTNGEGYLGAFGGANGTATVSGGNWTNSSFLMVGWNGRGRLDLSGGTVRNTDAYVGFAAGSNGTANVTGGTWVNSETLRVGEHGTGNFTLSNGTVTNTNGILATFSGANGTATITGGTWTNNGFLSVGREGTGNLNLSVGTVTNGEGYLGAFAGANGTATVSGGNWTNSSFLMVGWNGRGQLDLSGNGTVSASVVNVGDQASGMGTVNLSGGHLVTGQVARGLGGGSVTFDGGTLRLTQNQTALFSGFNPGNVSLSSGGGTIDTQGFTVASALGLSGVGSLTKAGAGSLTLSGESTYTGQTAVSEGSLLITGSISASTSVSVSSGAALGGTGTLGAASITGSLRPGVGGIGTLQAGTTRWSGASAGGSETDWTFELGDNDASDRLTVLGDFLKNEENGSVFRFDFGGSNRTGTFTLVSWTGLTTFAASDFSYTNLGGSQIGTFAIDGSSLQLTVIPEPSLWAGVIAGLLAVLAIRRRARLPQG